MINPLEQYALTYTKADPQLLQNLALETRDKMHGSHMLSSRIIGRLLKMLAQLVNARLVIDLGTYTGYSALSLAEALPSHGKVITLEKSTECLKIAKKYFNKSPHGHKIELKFGEAIQTLPTVPDNIDLVFMDADKQKVLEYYEIILPKMKSGGLIVVDNVFWHGKVLAGEARSNNLHTFTDHIVKDKRVENVILPLFDGVNIVRKK